MDKTLAYLAVVIVVGIALVVGYVLINSQRAASLIAYDDLPVPQSLIAQLRIPDNVSSAVGIGLATNPPKKITDAKLMINGKPAVIYVGADYCPYCALTRWGLIIALMRFGNFTGLRYMTSSPSDFSASTPTFTFSNATYTSSYITFQGVELYRNKMVNGTYPPLQSANATVNSIVGKYNSKGGIPFMDFANMTVQEGANYVDPTILDNKNWTFITGKLYNTSSAESRAIVGAANLLTAQICEIDNNTPASVCSQGYIQRIENNNLAK